MPESLCVLTLSQTDASEAFNCIFQIYYLDDQQRQLLDDSGKKNDGGYRKRQESRYRVLCDLWRSLAESTKEYYVSTYHAVEELIINVRSADGNEITK